MKNAGERLDVLLINPPYVTLTSRIGVGHQVPLGLLMVGGALRDAGFSVGLLDAECRHLEMAEVVGEVRRLRPRVVMTGHAGSTPAHGVCVEMMGAIKREMGRVGEEVVTVYGGPFPTYHAGEILRGEGVGGCEGASRGVVDVIVRGEGEATAVELVRALKHNTALEEVKGIAFLQMGEQATGLVDWDIGGGRIGGAAAEHGFVSTQPRGTRAGEVVMTGEREPLRLDEYRIGWELLDENESWDDYQCFGQGRAVIVQLSRGCPHGCTYCGQRGFWMKWRHRDPVALADEIEWLATRRGVRFVTLADENPTTHREVWRTFLQEMAKRELPVKFFSTIRATDIVRDADFLSLWAAAGIQYILLGVDATDEATLKAIKKGSTTRVDLEACRLLQKHGINSMVARIVGLVDERWMDFWRTAKQLSLYDGDYLNVMYGTPHAWTEFAAASRDRAVADERLSHWTYRWPVLGQRHMRVWEVFLAVKVLELWFHLRPGRVWRMLRKGEESRYQFWWCLTHIGHVWLAEIGAFFAEWPRGKGRTVGEFFGSAVGECRQEERVVTLRVSKGGKGARPGRYAELFLPCSSGPPR